MFDYHEAVLHAVREGLVLIDSRGNIALINDGARTLLGLPPEVQGTPVAETGCRRNWSRRCWPASRGRTRST